MMAFLLRPQCLMLNSREAPVRSSAPSAQLPSALGLKGVVLVLLRLVWVGGSPLLQVGVVLVVVQVILRWMLLYARLTGAPA
jgi:hypothetical protein